MALKFFSLVFLTVIVNGEASAPAARLISDSTYDPLPQYYFGYDVQDALTGDSKSQVETRNGDVVFGQYSLNDPDGTRRIVDYSSDSINGFNAVVRKAPLARATPIVAAAALTPVVEPVAVRAVAGPLVAARALPVAAPAPVQPVGPSRRSSQAASSNPSPSASSPPVASARSAQESSDSPLLSPNPSPLSVSSFSLIRSPGLQRSSNAVPSPNQSSGQLPSIPQLRAALNPPASLPSPSASSPEAASARTASSSPTLSESVEIRAATLESGPAAHQAASRSASVVAAPPVDAGGRVVAVPRVFGAPIAYAAAPAQLAYSGLVGPIAYNVW